MFHPFINSLRNRLIIIFLVRKKMMILVTISAREVVIQIRATRKTMPTKHRKIKKLAKLTTL
jgi:hypothetical protein